MWVYQKPESSEPLNRCLHRLCRTAHRSKPTLRFQNQMSRSRRMHHRKRFRPFRSR